MQLGGSRKRGNSQQNDNNFAYQPSTSQGASEWGSGGDNWGVDPNANSAPQGNYYGAQQQHQPQQQGGYNPYGGSAADAWAAPQQQDNSGYYANYSQQQQPPQHQNSQYGFGNLQDQLMANPMMMNAAAGAAEQFAAQGKEKLSKYVSVGRLKYYFAVDNAYVARKLGLLLFPWAQGNWTVGFSSEAGEPVPPKADVNAPDLYIPAMAILTYVLLCGFVLGTQGRFSPEALGATSSNALGWLFLENLALLLTKYVMAISSALSAWHSLAYSSYKFVGMIVCLVTFAAAGKSAYYVALAYTSAAIAFFLMRTVKGFVLDGPWGGGQDNGTKRKLYLLLFISLTQPFIMWWLTSSVTNFDGAAGPESMDAFIAEFQAQGGVLKDPTLPPPIAKVAAKDPPPPPPPPAAPAVPAQPVPVNQPAPPAQHSPPPSIEEQAPLGKVSLRNSTPSYTRNG